MHPHGFPANHHGRFLQFGYWILELCRVLNFVGMTEGLFCSFLVYILGIQSLRCRIFHLVKQAARTVWETLFFHTENVKLFLWAKISRRYLNLIQFKDFIFFQFESFLHDCVKTEQPIIVLYEKCEENLFRWLELWLHTDCSWFGWIWTYMYWHTGFCITVILMLLNVQILFFFFKTDLECMNGCFCRYLRLRVMLLKIPVKRFQQE